MSEGPAFKPKEDYPNNSDAARTPVPQVELRRPWWKVALGWLISDNIGDIKKDFIEPALKDTFLNIVNRVVRGTGNNQTSSGGYNYERTNYNAYGGGWMYSSQSQTQQQTNYSRGYSSSLDDYLDITFKNRADAEWFLGKVRECARVNGLVMVSDLWQILNIKRDNPMESRWGWTIEDSMRIDYTTGFGKWRFVWPPRRYFGE